MKSSAKAIREFWEWFGENPGKWEAPDDDFEEERFFEVEDALAKWFPELTILFLGGADEGFEITFSLWRNRDAKQRKAMTPVIRALVAAAPKLPLWRFHAFQEAVSWKDAFLPALELPGKSTLVIAKMRFEVLAKSPLALRVYVDHYTPAREAGFRIGVERVIETGMGEAWLLEKVDRLELAHVKKAPKTARRMQELEKL